MGSKHFWVVIAVISLGLGCRIYERFSYRHHHEPDTAVMHDTWSPTYSPRSLGRHAHTAVWIGAEMIVWGGMGGVDGQFFNSGYRYDPATDSWASVTLNNAPSARARHTAVWTGSEMIVWGGYELIPPDRGLNTGGKYNPQTDSWAETSIDNAPSARSFHTAVWSGTEMIIWGGYDHAKNKDLNTGARYDPVLDTWSPTAMTPYWEDEYGNWGIVPMPSSRHAALWTGAEMVVIPSVDPNCSTYTYDPQDDLWTGWWPPNILAGGRPIWTGDELILLRSDSSMFRLKLSTGEYDLWQNWPGEYRNLFTAIWTGTEMIVWGGLGKDNQGSTDRFLNTGGRYDPVSSSWTPTSTTNAPLGRKSHTAVWTGTEMIVWGGSNKGTPLATGGRYNPATDSWSATSDPAPARENTFVPAGRMYHSAIWANSQMIVWGGADVNGESINSGAKYDPATDSWAPISQTNAPSPRHVASSVWTGTEMLIWGGLNLSSIPCPGGDSWCFIPVNDYWNDGGRYNPAIDSWHPMSPTGEIPTARAGHSTVWTGTEMVVWGGYQSTLDAQYQLIYQFVDSGGRYNPDMDSWVATGATGAPSARYDHTAVWTGSEMIVWGGMYKDASLNYLNTGAKYSPSFNSWTDITTGNAPTGREGHTAVWTGTEMIVWGGYDSTLAFVESGGRYDPADDSWTETSLDNAPEPRWDHNAIWTGKEMLIWGGIQHQEGGIYDERLTTSYYLNSGGRYDPLTDSWQPVSMENAPSGRGAHTAVWTGSKMIIWGGDTYLGATDTGGVYTP